MVVLKSFAEATVLALLILFLGVIFGASEWLFSPVGFSAVVVTFFLEIFGNRW